MPLFRKLVRSFGFLASGWVVLASGAYAPLASLFKRLGAGIVRIGHDDSDLRTGVPTAPPVAGGTTSTNIGTADVDALATFLSATGWKVIDAVNIKTATAPSAQESAYASTKLGASLHSFEIGNDLDLMGIPYASARPTWEDFETAIRAHRHRAGASHQRGSRSRELSCEARHGSRP